MNCPECEGKTQVNQTKNYVDEYFGFFYIERRRVCSNCDHRMFTIELPQDKFIELRRQENGSECSVS
jgi:transcriptional regulator NrdR family protein